ncbi:hypothetical protein HKX48_008498 [Thoreauomyces humboldtii]|nr:hypothetical protein HKX48_008498 [Thoreauomyces humboldtii]
MSDFSHPVHAHPAQPLPPSSPSPPRSFNSLNGAAIDKDVVHTRTPVAPAPTATDSIDVSIRCPTFPSDSYTVTVSLDASIAQLKKVVSEVIPGRPPTTAMRLIHAGKLLGDPSIVRDHLKADAVIHLVVRNADDPVTPTSSTPRSTTPAIRPHSAPARPTVLPTPTAAAPAPQVQQLPQAAQPFQVVMINGLPYAMHAPAYHPMYQQPQNALPEHLASTSGHPIAAAPQALAPVQAPVPVPAPAPAVVPAAPAGPADDEFGDAEREAPQNPFWMLVKLTFLICVFSHNWPFIKIALVNVLAFVLFFVQVRRRARARRDAEAAAARPTAAPVPPLAHEGTGNAEVGAAENVTESTEGVSTADDSVLGAGATPSATVSVPPEPAAPSLKDVIVMFFLSLEPGTPRGRAIAA